MPKAAWRKPVTDVVEPGISLETQTAQQEVTPVVDVDYKDISKNSARQSREVKQDKGRPDTTGSPKAGAANMG